MLRFLLPTTLLSLLLLLPTLISAQCPTCDSYTGALKSCETSSINVTAVGTTIDTSSIHCMCLDHSNIAHMNACQGCIESTGNIAVTAVLLAWITTCKANLNFGDQQAVACWEGQPSDYLPCVAKGAQVGYGSPTSLPGANTSPVGSQPTTTTPATTVKSSDGIVSRGSETLSVFIVALAFALGF